MRKNADKDKWLTFSKGHEAVKTLYIEGLEKLSTWDNYKAEDGDDLMSEACEKLKELIQAAEDAEHILIRAMRESGCPSVKASSSSSSSAAAAAAAEPDFAIKDESSVWWESWCQNPVWLGSTDILGY